MVKRFKYGKMLLVIFLTCLIWVWADLSKYEDLEDRPAVIVVDESAEKLLVSLNQASSMDIKVDLSGPHTAVTEVSKMLREGQRLEFDFDVAREKMDNPGTYPLLLLPFLQKDKKIKQLGLKVNRCEPNSVDVEVVKLVEKTLTVQCEDQDGAVMDNAVSNPAQVNMLAPQDWRSREKLIAKVRLTQSDIRQASRVSPVEKTPYIKLTADKLRYSSEAVKITVEEGNLKNHGITAKLGYCFSENTQGKYEVQINNFTEVLSTINIKATDEAKLAYEAVPFHITLNILDDDKDKTGELRRKVIYNFPEEFVSRGEIRLQQTVPVVAKFELKLKTPTQ